MLDGKSNGSVDKMWDRKSNGSVDKCAWDIGKLEKGYDDMPLGIWKRKCGMEKGC